MKLKHLFIFSILALSIGSAGCKSDKKTSPAAPAPTATTPSELETKAKNESLSAKTSVEASQKVINDQAAIVATKKDEALAQKAAKDGAKTKTAVTELSGALAAMNAAKAEIDKKLATVTKQLNMILVPAKAEELKTAETNASANIATIEAELNTQAAAITPDQYSATAKEIKVSVEAIKAIQNEAAAKITTATAQETEAKAALATFTVAATPAPATPAPTTPVAPAAPTLYVVKATDNIINLLEEFFKITEANNKRTIGSTTWLSDIEKRITALDAECSKPDQTCSIYYNQNKAAVIEIGKWTFKNSVDQRLMDGSNQLLKERFLCPSTGIGSFEQYFKRFIEDTNGINVFIIPYSYRYEITGKDAEIFTVFITQGFKNGYDEAVKNNLCKKP